MNAALFRKKILDWYRIHGRHTLPWRSTDDPYRILVSEVMLQQTQVDRVIPKYTTFLKRFPTVQKLARAKLSDVLKLWSGLGYNRRAKYLHQMAQVVVGEYTGRFPKDTRELEKLPGVGPYTAGAICAFAYNQPVVFIETNIRTVYIYHFFPKAKKVGDKDILALVEQTLDTKNPREWYSALMDYGSYLKAMGVKNNAKSKHYTKQSTFEGSRRQIRGAILRELLKGANTLQELAKMLNREVGVIEEVLVELTKEGLVKNIREKYTL